MAADSQVGEDRHRPRTQRRPARAHGAAPQSRRRQRTPDDYPYPPEHRDWVESLPTGGAAALTVRQLERWPPSAQWGRLTALCVDLEPPTRKHVAAQIADRMYPNHDSDLCPYKRPPSQLQLAADTGWDHTTVAAAMRDLERDGWLALEDRGRGRAARVLLTVPELVRLDGVLEDDQGRREGRVQYAEPLRESERFRANLSESPRGSEGDGHAGHADGRSQGYGDAEPLRESERLPERPPESPNGPNGPNLSESPRGTSQRVRDHSSTAVGNPNPLPTEPVEQTLTGSGLPAGWSRSRELVECVEGDGVTVVRDESDRPRHPSCAGVA